MPNFKRRKRTDYIVVHCADTDPEWHGSVDINEVRKWHLDRGFIDVGYHLYIPRSGVVQIGRPIWAVGAHVAGHNHESVGICLEGGCKVTEVVDRLKDGTIKRSIRKDPAFNFTEAQLAALVAILSALEMKYPEAKVRGHRDFPNVYKYCPSFDVQSWWKTHRPIQLELFTETFDDEGGE